MVYDGQKKKITLIVLSLFIVALIIQTIVVHSMPKVLEEKIFEAKAEIGNGAGVLIEVKTLNFGRVPQRGYSEKDINIGNNYDKNVVVIAQAFGNIADMITFRTNNVFLNPGEETKITAVFNAEEYPEGNYTGYVKIVLVS